MIARYRRWWHDYAGSMLVVHWGVIGAIAVIALMATDELAGLIGMLVFLLVTIALVRVGLLLDLLLESKRAYNGD